ncbi:hypothetical protein T484DRAFT_1875050, partial [Baffinella frigidus]
GTTKRTEYTDKSLSRLCKLSRLRTHLELFPPSGGNDVTPRYCDVKSTLRKHLELFSADGNDPATATSRLVNARVTGHADAEARRSVVTALRVPTTDAADDLLGRA